MTVSLSIMYFYAFDEIIKVKSLCVWGSQNLSSDKNVPRYPQRSEVNFGR